MKKLVLWIIASSLLVVPSVYAVANSTSEGSTYYFSGDTFGFKDYLYTVDVNSYEEIILGFNDTFFVVRNGSCTKKGMYYEFCAESIGYDYGKKKKKVLLTIYSYEPEITVTRAISKSDMVVGEQTNLTVTLENTGFSKADNVTYTDTYIRDVNISVPIKYSKVEVKAKKVLLSNGSYANMSYVFWQGNLNPGDSVEFVYVITPLRPIDQMFSGNVHYFNGYKEVDEATDTITFKATSYFDIYTNIVDLGYEVTPGATDISSWEEKSPVYNGEEMLFVVDIVNKYSENKSINVTDMRFYIPDEIEYVGPYQIRVYGNASDVNSSYIEGGVKLDKAGSRLYSWSGIVLKDGKMFVLRLRAVKKGSPLIRVAADVKKDNMPAIEDYSVTNGFDISMEDIEIKSNIEEGGKFNSGQETYFTLYLMNPNYIVNFTDLNVSMNIPWVDKKNVHLDKVYAFNYKDIFDGNVVMPTVNKTESFKFYVNVSYTTQFGEKLNKTFAGSVRIDPIPDVEITHDIGSKSVRNSGSAEIDNKETEVTLKVKNKLEKDLEGVEIIEVFDKTLNPLGELSKKTLTLRNKETTDVYKYTIDPPDLSVWQNSTITTYISYVFKNQTYNGSFDVDLSIKPKMIDIDITKSIYEAEITRGQIAHVSYKIKNNDKGDINNVTLHFPVQYETDIVGARNFIIDEILAGETVVANNEEKIRFKLNGSVRIEKTNVSFRDDYGNYFNESSTIKTLDILKGDIEAPAIFINKLVPSNVTTGKPFEVNLTISNKGNVPAFVTVQYPGRWDSVRKYTVESYPGYDRSFVYNMTVKDSGFVELPANIANYTYKGLDYYTASNQVEVYSKGKVEKKAAVSYNETGIIEEAEATEKGIVINKKYIYLAVFVIMVCLIILFITKKKPKKGGLDFLEE